MGKRRKVQKYQSIGVLLFLMLIIILGLGSCGIVSKAEKEETENTGISSAQLLTETSTEKETKEPETEPETEPGTDSTVIEETADSENVSEDYELMVRFIDVGQGDASLITCNGHSMLIDGGRSSSSDKIYTILKDAGIKYLDYIVATHPEADHIGGLAGALNYATVGTAFSPVTEAEGEAFQNFKKYLDKQDVGITVPEAGQQYELGAAVFTILGPISLSESNNNNSIVIKLTCGDTSFLFTGDAEEKEEQDILSSGADLGSTVLKVGHHGSSTSTSNAWLNAVSPSYAVISCGKDNEYGHPAEDVLSRFKERDVTVLRTDLQGDIIFREENGEQLWCTVEKNTDADVYVAGTVKTSETDAKVVTSDELPVAPIIAEGSSSSGTVNRGNAFTEDNTSVAPTGTDYVVNTNTGKFHYPDCKSVKRMKEKNKMFFTGDRQELINKGYSPCGNCHP